LLVNQAGGLANLTNEQRAIIVAVSTFTGGVTAGALGLNVAGGANAATDEALYNGTNPSDVVNPENRPLVGIGEGGNGVGGGGGARDNAVFSDIWDTAVSEFEGFTSRYLSGAGGRWGSSDTRLLNYDVGQTLKTSGYNVTEGGGVASEEYIAGGGPGSKGGTYVDITAEPANGVGPTVRVQTVTTLRDGVTPTPSEAAAADRIQAAYPNDKVILIPKGASSSQINQAIQKALGK
jgi:filamentous hemagglutinin